jgi:predicted ribosome quality control (RQC) complex YloA/Tae2 family protein
MKEFIINNIKIKVGTNATENWELLSQAKDLNVFLHLSSFPSCYVIIETDDIPDIDILKEAANICKNNTKYKNLKNIKVDYTICNNVIKGDIVGEVYYKSNKKVKQIQI